MCKIIQGFAPATVLADLTGGSAASRRGCLPTTAPRFVHAARAFFEQAWLRGRVVA